MFCPRLIETKAASMTNQKYCLFKSLYEGVICDFFEVSHYKSLGYTETPSTFPSNQVDGCDEGEELERVKPVKLKRSRKNKQLDIDTEDHCGVVE